MNPHSNLVSGAGQDLYRVGADSWLNRDTVADRYLPPGLRGAASRAEIEHDASRDTTAAGRLGAPAPG